MWKKIKKCLLSIYNNKNVRAQIYSFVKTYATVFLTLYLRDTVTGEEGGTIILLNWVVISSAAKWSLIAVLRNLYKLITEK